MKRVLALLFAALLLTSLVSCNKHKDTDSGKDLPPVVDPKEQEDQKTTDVSTKTDEPDTPVVSTETDVPDTPVTPEIVWTDCDEIIYIVASSAYLRKDAGKDAELINLSAHLGESYRRVAVSENWSRILVSVEGTETEAYIVNDAVTTDDLSTDAFEKYADPVIRYVAVDSLNVRSFPTFNNSAYYKTLTKNDAIIVIGFRQDTDMSWYMINLQNEDGTYVTNADGSNAVFFVSAQPKYTSETKAEETIAEGTAQ